MCISKNIKMMSNPWFQFKKFRVYHDKSTMKVGTDAVLLACLTDYADINNILDVGCGSGIVSLMAAQLSNAAILAIDIHKASVIQADENFALSEWKQRLAAKKISSQQLADESLLKFDLIISNPPFFISSLKSPVSHRNLARHNDSLSHTDLLLAAKKLLQPTGRLSVILPTAEGNEFEIKAGEVGFYLKKRVEIKPNPAKIANRMVLEFVLETAIPTISELCIRNENNEYSPEYKSLTKDFYLKF